MSPVVMSSINCFYISVNHHYRTMRIATLRLKSTRSSTDIILTSPALSIVDCGHSSSGLRRLLVHSKRRTRYERPVEKSPCNPAPEIPLPESDEQTEGTTHPGRRADRNAPRSPLSGETLGTVRNHGGRYRGSVRRMRYSPVLMASLSVASVKLGSGLAAKLAWVDSPVSTAKRLRSRLAFALIARATESSTPG